MTRGNAPIRIAAAMLGIVLGLLFPAPPGHAETPAPAGVSGRIGLSAARSFIGNHAVAVSAGQTLAVYNDPGDSVPTYKILSGGTVLHTGPLHAHTVIQANGHWTLTLANDKPVTIGRIVSTGDVTVPAESTGTLIVQGGTAGTPAISVCCLNMSGGAIEALSEGSTALRASTNLTLGTSGFFTARVKGPYGTDTGAVRASGNVSVNQGGTLREVYETPQDTLTQDWSLPYFGGSLYCGTEDFSSYGWTVPETVEQGPGGFLAADNADGTAVLRGVRTEPRAASRFKIAQGGKHQLELAVTLRGRKTLHTVTFDAAGGTPQPEPYRDIRYGQAINEPQQPTRRGHVFRYWHLSGQPDTPWRFIGAADPDTVTGDLTLVARWTPPAAYELHCADLLALPVNDRYPVPVDNSLTQAEFLGRLSVKVWDSAAEAYLPDVTAAIPGYGAINYSLPGSYPVKLEASFTDAEGLPQTLERTVTAVIADRTPPVIDMAGRTVTVPAGRKPDPDALATALGIAVRDNWDASTTPVLVPCGFDWDSVNWNLENEYGVYVRAVDSAGNSAAQEAFILAVRR